MLLFFFFKQKTAYEMRISDWSSDVCSSDLEIFPRLGQGRGQRHGRRDQGGLCQARQHDRLDGARNQEGSAEAGRDHRRRRRISGDVARLWELQRRRQQRLCERSVERREGKEWDSKYRSWWSTTYL